MAKERLDQQRVINAALSVLDDVGVDGLTMRALAKALDVQAPTLYWHFSSKQALLEALADTIVATVAPDPPGEGLQSLRSLAVELRRALLTYRDGARAFAGTYVMGDNVLRIAERAVAGFLEAGSTASEAPHRAFNLIYYVLGFTIEEQAFREQFHKEPSLPTIKAKFTALAVDRFPILHANMDAILGTDFDARFELGLQTQLGGIGASV